MAELKPCPFCGGKAEVVKNLYFVNVLARTLTAVDMLVVCITKRKKKQSKLGTGG